MNVDPTVLSKVVRDVGFPVFAAILLFAAVFGWIPTPMLTEHRILIKQSTIHMRDDAIKTYLLRQICQNLAVDKGEARKCLADGPWE